MRALDLRVGSAELAIWGANAEDGADERVWYPANVYGGKCLVVAGVVSFALECLLASFAYFVPEEIFGGTNLDFWFFTVPMVAFLCVPLLVATVLTLVYVHRLNR